MDIISIIAGLAIGGVVAWVIATLTIKKGSQKSIEEHNRQADLIIQEARLTAKRAEDEAALKAEKIISKAEAENERIKLQKIQEAKERYAAMKQELETEKATAAGTERIRDRHRSTTAGFESGNGRHQCPFCRIGKPER